MPITIQEIYTQVVSKLSPTERLQLASLILNDLVQENEPVVDYSDTWTAQDIIDLSSFSLQYAATVYSEREEFE
ncbi:MAG TPA: hypothetical protein IGS52_22340 [Oscillatoriaceae cyanobacterium M33_DOE_052]|uniref:Uncharacterized protein n=1 Tax=Planktothricoides sp. SpSt-374 TaxID=2282167 RepID=A0A7C3ZLQ9_9CYAN|nr:hypothetical protein [Oscillatoriaceae cyanobacterium M33_DOE_052]